MKTLYEILELSPNATEDEIREQYRFLIQAWHPDKFGNPAQKEKALEKAKEINQAFDVLGKPEKRRQYDRGLAAAAVQPTAPSPPAGRPAPPPPPRPTQPGSEPERPGTSEAPPRRQPGISPLADFRWLLMFGDEFSYKLDEREAPSSGDFGYRLADWPVEDRPNARTYWQAGGYQVDVIKPPYQLIAGETSRCLAGGASLTAVTISLERDAPAQASFGILLNLSSLGDDPQEARRFPDMVGKGVPGSYYSFCLNASGGWEFRCTRGWQDREGILVERGFSAEIQRSVQRGRPLEVGGVIRDVLPAGRDQVRVRLGVNGALVCDLFTSGHAWRRGGVMLDAPTGGVQRVRFEEFQSYFLAQV